MMRPASGSDHGRRAWVLPAVALAFLGWNAMPATEPPSPAGREPTATPTVLDVPPDSPVERIVGGEAMATIGAPVVDDAAPRPPAVDARSWVVAEVDSGDVLAALSPHQRQAPASTIKLLTAVATIPELDPDDSYVVTDADASVEGSRVGLMPDQEYSVDQLLHGLMLASGNDAAHAVAEAAGGQKSTIELMNAEAQRLGAFDTHAETPHGLDAPGQLSSAYDLALIGRAALHDEDIARLAATRTYDFPGQGGETFQIQNQNRLLDTYPGAVGLKTGYTTLAAHTFVGAAERDGRTLIAVVLGAEGRAEPGAAALFDWAFNAPDITPVGHLVTAEEVDAMIREAEQDGDVLGRNPFDDYGEALRTPGGNSDGVPQVVWVSLVAAAVLGGAGFAVRRLSPRRPGGRYAPRR